MRDDRKILENQRDRGQIIRTLVLFHPMPISIKDLRHGLISKGFLRVAELPIHLHYLGIDLPHNEEIRSKYISRPEGGKTGVYEDDDLIQLTSQGYLLAGGEIDDPHIAL